MPLTWDMTRVENYEELGGDWDVMLTQAIALAMNECGVRELTAENAPEAYARIDSATRLNGALLWRDSADYYITPADVQRRIGMATNASTKTNAAFRKALVTELMDRGITEYARSTK